MGNLREDLLRSVGPCRETHVSWVFLGSTEVIKVKKPVSLGFLDFSTPEQRRRACVAEDTLNRRLAADVYGGVVPITRDARGVHHVGGDGAIVDWAVRMRRLPEENRGDALLAQGRLRPEDARQLAAVLAAFHARSSTDEHIRSFGRLDVLRRHTAENLRQSRRHPGSGETPTLLRAVARFQGRFLKENATLFDRRREEGFVREGHGDLRLDQLYFDQGKVVILDCIEFDERYRCVDTAADVAFLSMDFRKRGRPDLAEIFLAAYARASGDYALYTFINFYESQRAQVRALVAGVLTDDSTAAPEVREEARADVGQFLSLAREVGRQFSMKRSLVLVGGAIGAGKSTVSGKLSDAWAVPVVDSDSFRKRLLGRLPMDPLPPSAYGIDLTRRVYSLLGETAEAILRSGRTVILDATFRGRRERLAARALAHRCGASFLFVECRASEATCRERLRGRVGKPSVSDARENLWADFQASWEPVEELSPEEHRVVDTDRPPVDILWGLPLTL